MKKRKTGFESFAQVFLIVTIVVFVFGIIMIICFSVNSFRQKQNSNCFIIQILKK